MASTSAGLLAKSMSRRALRHGSGSAVRAAATGCRQAAVGEPIARRKLPQSSRNEANSAGALCRGDPGAGLRGVSGVEVEAGIAEGGRVIGVGFLLVLVIGAVPRIASSRSSSARSRRSRSAASRAASRPRSSLARACRTFSIRSSPGSCWRIRSSARSTWASLAPGGEVAGRADGPRLKRRRSETAPR